MSDEKPRGLMTVREAGTIGGEKRKSAIEPGGYEAMGRKGGAVTAARHGVDHFARIGKIGGQKLAADRGPEYFAVIGKRGGARIKAMCEQARAEEEALEK